MEQAAASEKQLIWTIYCKDSFFNLLIYMK